MASGRIGLRNIKTALSVMLCVLVNALLDMILNVIPVSGSILYRILDQYISRNMLVYACIAAVVVMCSSLSLSVRSGSERILGTFLGGVSGIVFLFIRENFLPFDTLILPLGVIVLIFFLTAVKKEDLVTVTLTVFFITFINSDTQAHIYVLSKVLATVLGTSTSLAVNFMIKPKGAKYE